MNAIFFFALVFCTLTGFLQGILHSEEAFDAHVVHLETESPLSPLYLVPMQTQESLFPEKYLLQLEGILAYDLDHNGQTRVAERESSCEKLLEGEIFQKFGKAANWREKHLFFVVKTRVQGDRLDAVLLDTEKGSIKTLSSFKLKGELNQDRRVIHKLADTIHKALYGIDGIASTKILFTIKTGTSTDSSKWMAEVWECDYDGANLRKLTCENAMCVTPVYIPPKKGGASGGFGFVSYQLGQPKIFLADLKEGKKRRLISMAGNQLMPAINRERTKIAFICDITGNPDLFIQPFTPELGAQGKPQQIFSAKSATQGSPTFSPDGTQIAFVSNKDGSPKIYVMPIPEAGASIRDIKPQLITKANRENSAPSWSPDGKKIAYCAKSSSERQIWVYDVETKQEKPVTEGPGNKENPSWAPNSLHLVYNSSDAGRCNLYTLNLNTKEPTQITFGSGEKLFPNWEPRAQ